MILMTKFSGTRGLGITSQGIYGPSYPGIFWFRHQKDKYTEAQTKLPTFYQHFHMDFFSMEFVLV